MAEDTEEKESESFVRRGTKEKPIEVAADDVLNAIAEGRDVDVRYAVIKGYRAKDSITSSFLTRSTTRMIHCDVVILKEDVEGIAANGARIHRVVNKRIISFWLAHTVESFLEIPGLEDICSFIG